MTVSPRRADRGSIRKKSQRKDNFLKRLVVDYADRKGDKIK